MEGQIWLESEGMGKGCTAIFIVKLGLCDQSSNLKQIVPAARQIHEDPNLSGSRPPFSDEKEQFPVKVRYQRSA